MGLLIESKIEKWGNGLGLRVSGIMRDIPQLLVNTHVTVEVFEDGFIVKKTMPPYKKLPFSEEELLFGLDENTSHSELLTTPLKSELTE